jgi:hypothetical protein
VVAVSTRAAVVLVICAALAVLLDVAVAGVLLVA